MDINMQKKNFDFCSCNSGCHPGKCYGPGQICIENCGTDWAECLRVPWLIETHTCIHLRVPWSNSSWGISYLWNAWTRHLVAMALATGSLAGFCFGQFGYNLITCNISQGAHMGHQLAENGFSSLWWDVIAWRKGSWIQSYSQTFGMRLLAMWACPVIQNSHGNLSVTVVTVLCPDWGLINLRVGFPYSSLISFAQVISFIAKLPCYCSWRSAEPPEAAPWACSEAPW